MDTSKIIKGVISGRNFTTTAPIIKEDYGLYLKIEGVELPSTYEVDFSNSENSGTSVTMIGNSDGVLIPHQFIDTGKDIFAFLYHVGANYGRTVYKFRIPNKVRPDRTNEEPTPEEQSVIDQAISALNSAVAQTAQDVIDADASAQSASADADRAERARDTAQGYSNNAQTSANNASASASQASASATASAQSASQSAQIKADVKELERDAQAAANSSGISARASGDFASQAQGFANSASASAQSASGYASNAQTSANTASTKASEASAKATESAQSASQALSYKTDAESAKTASQTAQGLAESARDTAVSAKTDAESARDDAETARDEAQQAVASISGALADKAPVITDTASGAIASFSDGADDLPLKSLIVDINPVQDLHGQDAPYPAGGGKNLLPPATSGEANGVTYTASADGTITLNGTCTNAIAITIHRLPLKSGTYSLCDFASGTFPSSNTVRTQIYDPNGTFYMGLNNSNSSNHIVQATLSEDTTVNYRIRLENGFTYNNCVLKPMLQSGEQTSMTFAPYENICPISGWTQVNVNHSDADMTNPTTLTINLGQTVYGSKLDVLNGKLTVDRAMVDLGTLDWSKNVGAWNTFSSANIKNIIRKYNGKIYTGGICSVYATIQSKISSIGDNYIYGSSVGEVRVKDTSKADLSTSEFKTAMSGIQYCFELDVATPITIQLTPNQVNSLLGVNNLWADSGDTEVEYRADTKLYISKKIAEAISALS